jgi:hypothetical protein
MTHTTIGVVSAMALLAAFSGPAQAGKPCKHTSERVYHTATGSGTEVDPYVVASEDTRVCDDKGKDGVAWTGDFDNEHLKPRMVDTDGDGTADTQLVVDGKPIFETEGSTKSGSHQHENPQVHGINGIAVGDNALVGKWVPASDNGTPDDTTDDIPGHYEQVDNSTAVGAGAKVTHNGSTALGAGAKSTDTDQVMLGTAKDTIKAEGITSQKSKDRQVGSLEVVTSDSQGNLATDGGAIYNQLGQYGSTLDSHSAMLSAHSKKLEEHSKGIAIAMALPDAWLESNKKFALAGNVGGFGDETAIGAAAIFRLDETWTINGKLGADTEFDQFGWTVGARASW